VRRFKAMSGRLVVIVPKDSRVGRIFRITGLDRALRVVRSSEEAVMRVAALRAAFQTQVSASAPFPNVDSSA